jgi:hypothetical protein
MDFRDALSAGLPSPRDDEPGGLRDDIVDELADHLACAYRRELLRGTDGATARRRVVEKFGDPAAVARRLWLDAMWGSIMTQRVLVACCVLLSAVSLAMAFMMWNQSVHAQRLVERERALAERMRYEAEIAQKKMLEQLSEISKANARSQSSGWTPVTFKLTQETPDGPPVVGYHLRLGRATGGSSKPDAIQRDSDELGMADFGVVQPGDWEFTLHRDLEPGKAWSARGTMNVKLESSIDKTIICPKVPADDLDVKFHIIKPKDFDDRDLKIIAGFEHQGFTFQPPIHWQLQSYSFTPGFAYNAPSTYLVGEAEGVGIVLRDPHQVKFWAFLDGSVSGRVQADPVKAPAFLSSPHLFADVLDPRSENGRKLGPKGWMPGTYRMTQLVIGRPSKYQRATFPGQRFDVMSFAYNQNQRLVVSKLEAPPGYPSGRQDRTPNFGQLELDNPLDIDRLLPEDQRLFQAESARPNDWTIRIPDELVKACREKLASAEASRN